MRMLTLLLSASLLIAAVAGCSGGTNGERHVSSPAAGIESPTGKERDIPAGEKGEPVKIVFSAYEANAFYEEAKREYERLHPHVRIELDLPVKGQSDLSGQLLQKFRETTNAKFLSGQGPDIIEMDRLPMDQYRGKGLLADLSELMSQDADFEREQYFTNVLEHADTGGLYIFPLNFSVEGLMGDEALMSQSGMNVQDDTWDWTVFEQTVNELQRLGGHEYGYAYKSEESLLYDWVQSQYPKLVDEQSREASFDSGLFTGMLTAIKEMQANKVLAANPAQLISGSVYFQEVHLASPEDYLLNLSAVPYEQPAFYAKPKAQEGQAGTYFRTQNNLGINAHSKVKQEAWDFLRFLTSRAWTDMPKLFPINKSVYEEQKQTLLTDGTVKGNPFGRYEGGPIPVTQQRLEELDAILAGAKLQKSYLSMTIEGILFEETPAFFTGQKTAEEVAALIQNKVQTYLNE